MDEILNIMKLGFIAYGYVLAFSLLLITVLGDQIIPPNNDCKLFNEGPYVGMFLGCSFLVSFLLLTFLPYLL